MLGPILDEIAKEKNDVKIAEADVDVVPKLATKYGVVSIPSLFYIKNGEVVNQDIGYKTKEEVLSFIK